MKAKIKRFFESTGFTKSQLITVFLCYFLCFALFLGVVVIWDPMSKSLSEQTIAADDTTLTGPTNTEGSWITDDRYSIEWFKNAQSVEIDGTTYQPGTKQNPYKIDSAEDLAGLSYLVYTKGQEGNPLVSGTDYSGNYIFQRKYFKQTANIDLSAYYWQPIGINYTREGATRQNYFSGNYDGGNHTVSGIFTPAGTTNAYSYQGLFGRVYSSSSSYPVTIQNIGITNSFIQGYQYVGGIVGYAYASSSGNTTITNCYNKGAVTGSGSRVGGVVGSAGSNTTIESCYNTGDVGGSSHVGGVVGSSSGTTITNCYNTGSVESSGNDVGGVVGYAGASSGTITITNCYNTGAVSGSSAVGGVVGYTYGTITITNCYNTGSVSGSSNVGGVLGEASASSGSLTITNCYNTGAVTGSSRVGGVVGYAFGTITITNCYNTGAVSGSGDYVGGVVGYAYVYSSSVTITITNCYNIGSVTGSSDVGGVVGYAYASSGATITITNCYYGVKCSENVGGINGADVPGQAEHSSTLTENSPKTLTWYTTPSNWNSPSWDFENVWVLDSGRNDGYPSFIITYWISDPSYYSIEWFNNPDTETYGDGSESNPYIIDSAEDLAGLSWLVYTRGQEENPLVEGTDFSINGSSFSVFENKHFIQSENIDLSAHVWQPIGIYYTREGTTRQNYFSGNYDGQGFTVSGISTPEGQTNAYSNQGLFGYCDLSDMNQSYEIKNVNIVNSNIKGYDHVGGVVGRCGNADLYLINCSNFGSVSGNQWVGGIIGNSYKPILNCYNGGEIFGNAYVGGINGDGNNIIKCYNIGKVRGSTSVGGIVGRGVAKYCYNQGEVSGTTYVGGIVGGFVNWSSFASRCYNTGTITGDDYVAGIVGYSHSVDSTNDGSDVIAYNINIGQIQGVTNVGQIASACERTELIKNYFNTGSSADTVNGATYDTNSENYLYDEAWLYENLFWDIGFTYKISQDAYPTFRTEEEKNSWLNESLVEINTNWEGLGTIDEPYKISSAEDLAGLAVAVNTGMIGNETLEYSTVQTPLGIQAQVYFQGIYFEQTADIDLSSHYWESIGQVSANLEKLIAFGGNYNGNNYKISGLKTVENIYTYQINSLFSSIIGTSTQKAEIKNINFDKTNFVASPTMFNGILAGMSFDAQINNCKFEGNIFIPHEYAEPYIFGGVVGSYAVDSIITDCINYCNIYSEFSADAICGIVGMLASFSLEGNAKIENCVNYGNFSGAGNMYGICYAVMMGEISGCKNYGNMTSSDIKMSPDRSDEIVCGIVGEVENGQIKNCENYGQLISNAVNTSGNDVVYVAGIVIDSKDSTINNCYNYGNISSGLISESNQVFPSGIAGSINSTTINDSNNYGKIEGVYCSGIVGTVSGISTIYNCNNFGHLKGMFCSAGVGMAISNGTTIENCGSFGNLETTAEGGMNMGIAYAPVQDSTVDTDQYFIRNCLVDVKVIFNKDQTLFGGIMGMAYGDGASVSPYIDNCFVKSELSLPEVLTLTSFDVIDAINGVYPDSSFTADINCYGVITGNGIPTIKHISGLTTEMEGNFVYLDGFYDDMPVPIKTDGTNFFHMHDFGSTTGIVEKINDVLYPNLLLENIVTNTLQWEGEAPSIADVDILDLDLDVEVGKIYEISMLIDGQEVITTKEALYLDQDNPSNSPIGLGDGINANINGVDYFIVINIDCVVDDSGAWSYSPGKAIFIGNGNNGASPSVPLVFTSIREVPEKTLLNGTIESESVDRANPSFEVIGKVDYSLGLVEGKNYKLDFKVEDKLYSVVKQCFAGDSPNNMGVAGALTISDASGTNGNVINYNGHEYLILIAQDIDFIDLGNVVYSSGKTALYLIGLDDGPVIKCILFGVTQID